MISRFLQLEYIKYRYSRTFWVINLIFIGLLALGVLLILGNDKRALSFPMVWINFTYLASFFDILAGLLIISSVTAEYQFKTLRQHIIEGMSRKQFLAAKYLLVILIGLVFSLLVFGVDLIAGFSFTQAGQSYSLSQGAGQVVMYFLQLFGYMSLAMTFALLFRNPAMASVLYIVYVWMFEWILQLLFRNSEILASVAAYFPKTLFGALVEQPSRIKTIMTLSGMGGTGMSQVTIVLVSFAWFIFFAAVNYLLLKKRDL